MPRTFKFVYFIKVVFGIKLKNITYNGKNVMIVQINNKEALINARFHLMNTKKGRSFISWELNSCS